MDLEKIRSKISELGFSKQFEGVSETYEEPNQTSKMEHFVKIVEG